MPDNLNNRHGQDRTRINLQESWEVQYWTKELGVTREQLEAAVKKAGSSVQAVRDELGAGQGADDNRGTRH